MGRNITFMIVDNNFEILLDVNNEKLNEKDKREIISYSGDYENYAVSSQKLGKVIKIINKDRYFIYKRLEMEGMQLGGIFFVFDREDSIIENAKEVSLIEDIIKKDIEIMNRFNKIQLVFDYYSKSMEIMNLGVLIINSREIVLHTNEVGANKLCIEIENLIGKSIKEIFGEFEITQFFYGKRYQFQKRVLCKLNNQAFNISVFSIDSEDRLQYAGIVLEDVKISSGTEDDYQYSPIYFQDIIGENDKFKFIKDFAMNIAHKEADILILGESGTGKELFARAIHSASNRRKGPFIAINCSAIPNDLLESELFGYQSGAFTGASRGGKPGKFELANGGIIFLDEIGDMTFYLQAKLLRIIQERTFERVGGVKSIKIDIRIIAATNKDLKTMVNSGTFREDLYYRLNVIPLMLPAVRNRKDDIPILVEYFFEKYKNAYGNKIDGFENEALKTLFSYDWPGNIRELDNTIQFLCCVSSTKIIETALVERRIGFSLKKVKDSHEIGEMNKAVIPLRDVERAVIINAISVFGDTARGKELAARALGIGKSTLYKKIVDYNIIDV